MKKTIWAMFAVIIVLFAVVAWGFFEYVYEPRDTVDLTEELDDEDAKDSENESDEEDEEKFDPESVENVRSVSAGFTTEDIIYTEIVERSSVELLDPYMSAMQAAENKTDYPRDISEDYIFNFVDIYEFGVVASGDYAGDKLLSMYVACDGPCDGVYGYRFIYDEESEEFFFLNDNSTSNTSFAPFLDPLLNNTADVSFDALNLPSHLTMPGGARLNLSSEGINLAKFSGFRESGIVAFTDSNYGKVYYNSQGGCYYVISPDDVVARYELDLGFVGEGSDSIRTPSGKFLFLNQDYQLEQGGCGITGTCFSTTEVDESNLKSLGTSTSGQEFFVPIKYDESGEHYTYKSDMTKPATFYRWRWGDYEDLSYNEYMDMYPVLFWKDPLGRWTTLVNNDFAPGAECGKPVIYLYPEEKMEVSVKVLLDELTVTDPEHGEDGWRVEAQPNGRLVNLVDGENYDYLFWEGHKDPVLEAEKGFMVEKDDVKKFLRSSLKQMGLNRAECKDFMEFWVPVMMDYEYPRFFVSFVGTEEFNKVAPLQVEPKPDTMYRIFMYFEPTFDNRVVMPQELNSFERKGFTLVEWGGTSSIPWK